MYFSASIAPIVLFLININSETVFGSRVVFECNFDKQNTVVDACGGSKVTNTPGLNGPQATILNSDSVTGTNPLLYVTDVTSITGPTFGSNDKCKIPYTYNGIEYNFCNQDGGKYSCETVNNDIRECIRENYLRVKSNNAGGTFTSIFSKNDAIDLPEAGEYVLSAYTFINCPNQNCETAKDLISIKIKEEGGIDYKEIFKTGFENGRIRDNKWNYELARFVTETKKIELRIEFRRQTAVSNAQGFMAIDEIKIQQYDESIFTTTAPTTTSSTTTTTTTDSTTTSTITTTSTTTTASTITTTSTTTTASTTTDSTTTTSTTDSTTATTTTDSTTTSTTTTTTSTTTTTTTTDSTTLDSTTTSTITTTSTTTTASTTTDSTTTTSTTTTTITTTTDSTTTDSTITSTITTTSTTTTTTSTTTTTITTTTDSTITSTISTTSTTTTASTTTDSTTATTTTDSTTATTTTDSTSPSTPSTPRPITTTKTTTTTTTTTTSEEEATTKETTTNVGAIVGGTIGGIAGVVILIVVCVILYKKLIKKPVNPEENDEENKTAEAHV